MQVILVRFVYADSSWCHPSDKSHRLFLIENRGQGASSLLVLGRKGKCRVSPAFAVSQFLSKIICMPKWHNLGWCTLIPFNSDTDLLVCCLWLILQNKGRVE